MFIVTPLRKLGQIARETFETRGSSNYYYLAVGLQASLLGYMVSSFFLSVAYVWYVYYLWLCGLPAPSLRSGNGKAVVVETRKERKRKERSETTALRSSVKPDGGKHMTLRFIAEVIFWLSAAALFYTYAGYPLLLALVSTLRPRRVRRGEFESTVSVIITAYNEERDLASETRKHSRARLSAGTTRNNCRFRLFQRSHGRDRSRIRLARRAPSSSTETIG